MSDHDASPVEQWLRRTTEFPPGAALPPGDVSRREFVSLLGASLALAGLSGCVREPAEKILPYVTEPHDALPGTAVHFATAMTLDGYATGLVVESRDGRPVKIEGNPDHPASLGAAGVYEQASLLQLYDPNRARYPRASTRRAQWAAIAAALAPTALTPHVGAGGGGLRLLLEPTSSPLIAEMLARVRARYPDARVYFHAPLASATPVAASRELLGGALAPQYDLTGADVVVSIGADFLASGPFHLRYARDFAQSAPNAERRGRRRLFVAETLPTPTGSLAQHHLAATPTERARLAAALFDAVTNSAANTGRVRAPSARGAAIPLPSAHREWVSAAAADLVASGGRAAVIAGDREPADVHVLAQAINAAVGAVGHTTWYTAPAIVEAGEPSHDLSSLAAEIRGGQVDTLVVLEGNPAYAAPGDLDFARALRSVRNTLYLGPYDDETARVSTWHVPAAHYLETWGDARAYDGTLSLVQPLIAPMYGGRTPAEVLAIVAGQNGADAHALLRELHGANAPEPSLGDSAWDDALRQGLVVGSAFPRLTPAVRSPAAEAAYERIASASRPAPVEISFVPAAGVYDGRFANNAWLQELPDPTTKLTWDNAALLSPALASRLGVESGDQLTLRLHGRTLTLPALPVPGHADSAVSIALGYGRSGAEAVARGVGANANQLRRWNAAATDAGVTLARTGTRRALAVTQSHWSLEGRGAEIVGLATREPGVQPAAPVATQTPRPKRRPLTLYEPPPPSLDGFGADQWAMAIDLDRCTGCSACVIACQAENNIPVVGRDGVLESREMHWIRIDRYLEGSPDSPSVISQPMLCQHCEKAPCEYVCPVGATMHSDDGLNEMVYNRCVGTRFCSNNCPYKVRRFNWFDYNAEIAETERMVKNPEVTVRGRGVMEKCTFCVQRIRRAQKDAELAGDQATEPVMTACMQTCPTRAIVFGSLTSPGSEVARLRDDPRAFSALEQLGTEPRVRYLARSDSASDRGGNERSR
jgi:molybdopterin-containing oxidoreductase family iron-sulfur binding subunit